MPSRDPRVGAGDDGPGTAAARARLDDLLGRLARLDLQIAVVAPPDATRLAARDTARIAADGAGRGRLFDDATAAVRDWTLRSFARRGFSGTWAVTETGVSVASGRDRLRAAAGLEEAAMAAVVEDLVDDDTLEVLRSTVDELGNLAGLPSPGSISSIASPDRSRGPVAVALGAGVLVLLVTLAPVAGPTQVVLAIAVALAVGVGLARSRAGARG
ncbi:MAG: hypothetical protein ACJ761_05315 [Chloroflexota bacterium]